MTCRNCLLLHHEVHACLLAPSLLLKLLLLPPPPLLLPLRAWSCWHTMLLLFSRVVRLEPGAGSEQQPVVAASHDVFQWQPQQQLTSHQQLQHLAVPAAAGLCSQKQLEWTSAARCNVKSAVAGWQQHHRWLL
jgi:hypothetical protein